MKECTIRPQSSVHQNCVAVYSTIAVESIGLGYFLLVFYSRLPPTPHSFGPTFLSLLLSRYI